MNFQQRQALLGLRSTLQILLDRLRELDESEAGRPRQFGISMQDRANPGRMPNTVFIEAHYWQEAAREAKGRGKIPDSMQVIRIVDDGGRIVWERLPELGL